MAEILRKPRNHAGRGGYKLTVFKHEGKWEVRYVSEVDQHGLVWAVPCFGVTTQYPGIDPFPTWEAAMAHAATLRTYYGDQCRGDNLLWNRRHSTHTPTSGA